MKKLWALACGNPNIWTYQDKKTASWCYLHGKLERMNGFDLFGIDINDWDNLVAQGNGVEKVIVALSNGNIEVADIYFWKPKYYDKYDKAKVEYDKLVKQYDGYEPADMKEYFEIQKLFINAYHKMDTYESQIECAPIRALVVLPWDTDSVEYAKKMQKERVEFL